MQAVEKKNFRIIMSSTILSKEGQILGLMHQKGMNHFVSENYDASVLVSHYCCKKLARFQFRSVQLLSCVELFLTPRTAAHQATLSITNSWSLLKLLIESVMPSNHLTFCHPLLLPPSIFPSIRVFSNESVLCIRWPKD